MGNTGRINLAQFNARNPALAQIAIILVALAAWALFLPHVQQAAPWIYSWDSAAYIEAANSLHAGRGCSQRVIDGLGHDIWEPMSWWPPGYSLLISFIMMFGVSAKTACLIVAGANGAISIVLLGLIAGRLLNWKIALPLTTAVAVSVAFQKVSIQCMSDTSYLMLVLASVAGIVFWTTSEKQSWRWLFAAGLFAGAAWVTRNTGLALVAATGVFFLIHLYWMPLRRVISIGLVWAAGAVICAVPLIVHNLIVFGQINAYYMPPSELSFFYNVRRAVYVIVRDMTTLDFLATGVSAHLVIVAVLLAAFGAALAWWQLRRPIRRAAFFGAIPGFVERYRLPVLLLAYAAAYSAIVIIARSRYRWGEEIDPRHMFQVYWALWLCLAIGGLALIRQRAQTLVAGAAVAVALLQTYDTARYSSRPADRIDTMERRVGPAACTYLNAHVGPDAIVLSTRAEILRIFCDVNARKIPPVAQYYKLDPITREDLRREGENGFLWGIVIEDVELAKRGGLGPEFQDMAEHPDDQPGLRWVERDSPAIILEYVGDSVP